MLETVFIFLLRPHFSPLSSIANYAYRLSTIIEVAIKIPAQLTISAAHSRFEAELANFHEIDLYMLVFQQESLNSNWNSCVISRPVSCGGTNANYIHNFQFIRN